MYKRQVDYYTLTVTAADAVNNDPAITSAKLTLGEGEDKDEYTAAIKDKTITFTVPYSTEDDIDGKGEIVYALTPATQKTENITWTDPVSYTHLDVYKRQGRYGSAFQPRFPVCRGAGSLFSADCGW